MAPRIFSDAELLDLLRDGDHAAFHQIYKRYWRKLFHLALQKTGVAAEAEHMVQDIFAALWERRETLVITRDLGGYLYVCVKYRVFKFLARPQTSGLYDEAGEPLLDVIDETTQHYLDFAPLRDRLEAFMGELPEHARLIFQLHRDGYSHREIAEEMDMSEKAVNAQLVRTRKSLRTALGSFLHTVLL